ncbi:MAG: 3-hydroxyacyl-CoA dehydrogenase NAD-binding domain-containing protein, partial [Rhodobacteraceae bacterium]|nr:3-hydroxyacyl-CoA dehydrogenase NAD-binding domain-containing protein [Paracoccaceae bacterium]
MEIKRVGVIGAGQMGSGIAHVFAVAGFDVCLHDLSFEVSFHALQRIQSDMDAMIERGRLTGAEKDGAIGRITTTTDMGDLADVDLIVEAASEDTAIKEKIFSEICRNLGKDTLLTTNTSSISITRLAAKADRRERFMGVELMRPVAKR